MDTPPYKLKLHFIIHIDGNQKMEKVILINFVGNA